MEIVTQNPHGHLIVTATTPVVVESPALYDESQVQWGIHVDVHVSKYNL